MPQIRWEDIGNIKHNIVNSLVKVAKIEDCAHKLKTEILAEVDRLNSIIERIPEGDRNNKPIERERRTTKEGEA